MEKSANISAQFWLHGGLKGFPQNLGAEALNHIMVSDSLYGMRYLMHNMRNSHNYKNQLELVLFAQLVIMEDEMPRVVGEWYK